MTHRQQAMRAPSVWRSVTLEKTGNRKADAGQLSGDLGLIEREIGIRPAICQPRQLHAERRVRFGFPCGKEFRVPTRKKKILFLWAIGDVTIHMILRLR